MRPIGISLSPAVIALAHSVTASSGTRPATVTPFANHEDRDERDQHDERDGNDAAHGEVSCAGANSWTTCLETPCCVFSQ